MINTIIDIYHGNNVDLQKAWNGRIVAIIHKATQGTGIRDSTYHDRREQAKKLGFLWGAYHFSTGGSVSDQVANFLTYAKPEDNELISLDWEPSDGPDMTLEQAQHFVQMIRDETGRWPVVYGGHLLREEIGHNPDPILSNCPLCTSAMPTPRPEFRPKSGRPILYGNTPMAMLDQNLMGHLARRAQIGTSSKAIRRS
jgi:lysozyme